jgi:hypothetical protein
MMLLSLGGAALVVLLAGLAGRWSAAVTVGVALLGAQQSLRLALGPDELDEWTPVIAATLLFVAELAWWSLEPRVRTWAKPWSASRRLSTVLLACIGGSIVAALVLVAAGTRVGGGVALELAGVVAAAAALALVAWVARTRVG